MENFHRYGMEPKRRGRLTSTWYEHKLLAEAERLSPGFARECDEQRKHGRFGVREARRRAHEIIEKANKERAAAAAAVAGHS